MYIENTGIENIIADISVLDEIMLNNDLIRAGQWDYERATYDKKYVMKEGTFYLRVFCYTKEGDVDKRDAIMILKKPVLGKHYYPHGVEYGEDENFPKSLVKDCEATLKAVNSALTPYNLKK
ncbi:YugN family protein [Sporosarcina sp. G11-34]|uniref:YugN family protein n=1 Tax=Sporosarcina sp. G11-34 TaxID=2849605 RepID=UPI0022A90C5A|nr:YugN family protein [Sporosarcina sp. G11-34]MCZ2258901.1 YugN-like family protein [Sporosarcina sp. G11-34]